ncbi:hypothetical protein [Arthrobacter sp. D1-17]
MDFTRYFLGFAILLGSMLLSLLCAHLVYRWCLRRHDRARKGLEPAATAK